MKLYKRFPWINLGTFLLLSCEVEFLNAKTHYENMEALNMTFEAVYLKVEALYVKQDVCT